ncbi:TC1D2 protein, partial [Polypterus senegalus]
MLDYLAQQVRRHPFRVNGLLEVLERQLVVTQLGESEKPARGVQQGCVATPEPTRCAPEAPAKLRNRVPTRPRCFKCGEVGHIVNSCLHNLEPMDCSWAKGERFVTAEIVFGVTTKEDKLPWTVLSPDNGSSFSLAMASQQRLHDVLKCLVVSNWDEKRRRLRRRLCLQGGSEWEMESGGEAAESSYIIRPNFQHKFKGALVKECIRSVLKTELASKQYDPEEVGTLSRSLSQTILDQLKKLGFHRYKLVVQVVLGEQRGEGVKCFTNGGFKFKQVIEEEEKGGVKWGHRRRLCSCQNTTLHCGEGNGTTGTVQRVDFQAL